MADALQLAVILTGQNLASGAIDGATASFDKMGGAAGAASKLVLGAAVVAGGALVAGLGTSVAAAANFEEKMSGVGAVSGATAGELKSLSGLALQLGKDTSFSASEAASGIEELVKGGLTIPDIMNGAAQATLNLAAAGGVSLPDAATIAANALAQFNLKGEDMAHVADLIAGAANASALDVGQFKFSLQAAGAVAATVGFSFDDLAQGIAIMGKAGIVGQDAGTSLKTMMMSLQPSTKGAAKEMRALGIITADGANQFFDAQGKVKSMADVAGILQKSTAGLTQAQKLQALQTIFGSDAIRAAAVFAKEGATGFNDMAESMGKVTAAQVGAAKLDNLKGSVQQLAGSWETLQISFGVAFLPLIRGAVDAGTGILNNLIPVFDKLGPQIVNGVTKGADAIRAFLDGDVLKAGAILGQAFDFDAMPLVNSIKSAQDAVSSFVGALSGNWQPSPGIGQFADIAGRIGLVIGEVKNGVLSFTGALQGDWQPAPGISAFATIAGNLGLIIGTVKNGVQTFVGALQGEWKPAPGIDAFSTMAGNLGTLLKNTVIPAVQSFAADPMTAVKTAFDNVKTAMEPFAPTATRIGTAIDAISTAVKALVPEPVGTFISNLAKGATSSDTLTTASGLLKGAFDLAVIAVNAVSKGIDDGITMVKGIADAIPKAVDQVKAFSDALVNNHPLMATASAIGGGLAAVTALQAVNYGIMVAAMIPATAASIARAVASAAETVAIVALIAADGAAAIATGILTAAQAALNVVMTANPIGVLIVGLAALAGLLIYAYNNSKEFHDQVDGLWAGIKVGIAVLDDIETKIRTAWNGAIDSAKQVILGFVSSTWQWGANAVQGFIDGITGKKQAAGAAAAAVAGAAEEAARTRLDMRSPSRVFEEIGAQTIEGFVKGIDGGKAKAAAEVASAVFGAIKAGTEALKGLAGFQAPDAGNIDAFAESTRQVVQAMGDSAVGMSKKFLEQASLYADSAGKALGIIGSGVAGLMALNKFTAPSADAIAVFKENTQQLVESLGDSAATMSTSFIEHAGVYADAAGKALGILSTGVAGLMALNKFAAPSADAIAVFKVNTEQLVQSLGDSAVLLGIEFVGNAGKYAEAAGKALGILANGAAGLMALNTFTAPTADAIAVFKVNTEQLVQSLGDSADFVGKDLVAHAGTYAEAAGKALGIIGNGVAGLMKLAEFVRPGDAAIAAFKFATEQLVTSLGDSAAAMKEGLLTHASAFSDAAGKALGVLGTGVDALTKLNDFVAPSKEAINNFLIAALYVVDELGKTASVLQTDGIAKTAAFSAAAGAALGAAKTGIDAFVAMGKLTVPSKEAINNLIVGIVEVVDRMGELSIKVGVDGVARAVAFAKACADVFGGIKDALELFKQIAQYQHHPVKAMEDLLGQMVTALKLAGNAVSQSESFARRAKEFKDNMQQAARDFAAGAAAGKGAGAGIPDSSAPSAPAPSAAAVAGKSLAGKSLAFTLPVAASGLAQPQTYTLPAPSGRSQAMAFGGNAGGAGEPTITVNVTVQGSVQTERDIAQAIYDKLRGLSRQNGGLNIAATGNL